MTDHLSSNDEFTEKLTQNVFPSNWKNPKPSEIYDLVVIGGGPGGLTAASIARDLHAKVAIVEKNHLGGECLSAGCIPSKALIRCSRLAAEIHEASKYGIEVPPGWKVDFGAVMRHVHQLQATLSPHDAASHFQKLGIDIFLGAGHFISPSQLEVGGQVINFKKAIVVTGTQPIPLSVSGIEPSDYLTNQNIFTLSSLPRRLVTIGGGPINCELSQAFCRLGSQVTLITRGDTLLSKDESMATERLQKVIEMEGVRIVKNSQVRQIEKRGEEKIVYLNNSSEGIVADAILVGIGRIPAVEDLSLEKGSVAYDLKKGITTNDYLQTSNPNVYAAGDVCSPYKFTHISTELSKMAVLNALNGNHLNKNNLIIPWCTYTDPEIAHTGLTEKEAREKGISVEIAIVELSDNDRALLDGETIGFAKLLVKAGSDQIVGATLMTGHAGEMISEITVAMASDKGLFELAQSIHPFPTQAEVFRRAAQAILKSRLQTSS
jgi:pyruvate/2-oxoglutarate dehydrogenase complex dihydrolipoamide dehydrogenase (E3) component